MPDHTNVNDSKDGVGAYRADNTPIDLNQGKLGPPRTFQVLDQGGSQRIIWFYSGAVNAPARKTMVIKYTVTGGLRYYTGGDQLWWDPFLPNRSAGRINQARLTVQVPSNIDLTAAGANAVTFPAGAGRVQVSPQQAVFTASSPLNPSDQFEAQLTWPHGLIPGTAPPWQAADDRRRAAQEQANLQQSWDS